ncbi:efflux RND transporter periplasmic adaptor subunit [Pokkaliibacter sp. MBI-7]|uniref:efflux RND transporter periplasmic adaptor subunit n=1 Tax=Pokkaliibacter sp. MBI-7 TaxID=3040600 RepID=UPI00244C7AA7|nr:efflux RND transporter periplasmic adaptor subunit [Pokkaliibacter sp. MBI-7]MDH2432582.1 efflux RND transporter periplasmic adaptor subunit [Pokkaliibacter sp. MBI-7]
MHVNRRTRLAVAVLVSAMSVVLSGCNQQESAGAAQQAQQGGAQQPVEVGIYTVQPQAVTLTTELPGRTSAYLVSEVRPQVGGIIQKRLFTEGSDVKAGDVLYLIDPATYEAELESAKANLARADANVESARLKAKRYKELVQINAVSKQDYDDADASLKQSLADVAAYKAAIRSAQINLNYTKVTSPISGRIGKSSVTPGALVTANQTTALATVQQLDPVYVDVTQSSVDMLRLKRELANGQLSKASASDEAKVKLILEDGSLYPDEGKLAFSDVSVNESTGAVTLRAVFPNPNIILLPGMYVRAEIEEGVREQGILVPQQGVTRDIKGNAVAMVINSQGIVEMHTLKTNRAIGDKWLIDDGLKAGDQVIVEGLQKVRPGAPAKGVAAGQAQAAAAKQG